MDNQPSFDLKAAHAYFSAHCFNKAWELLDKPARTADEDEQMIRLCLASTWHWTERPDCTSTNLSVGYWQTARTYATLKQADNARRYGQLCLAASRAESVAPFYLGYAFEALARAEMTAGDLTKMQAYLEQARQAADKVTDQEERKMLLDDLATIR